MAIERHFCSLIAAQYFEFRCVFLALDCQQIRHTVEPRPAGNTCHRRGPVMKRFVVACVGLLALAAGSASAADLPVRYAQPYRAPIYAPVYGWAGFYIGINGGGGWGR